MEKINDLIKPMEAFNHAYEIHKQNVNEMFDQLSKESNVDIDANAKTCQTIYAKQKERDKAASYKRGLGVGKGFSIAGAVIGFGLLLFGILSLAVWHVKGSIPIIFISVGLAAGIGFTLLICLVINKAIKNAKSKIADLEEEIKKYTDEAWEQMKPLNQLWTWNMPQHLINGIFAPDAKTDTPLVYLDRVFAPKRYTHLVERYNLNENIFGNDESVIAVQSGEIRGNPFLFTKTMYMNMGMQIYTGTLVVTWTTTERDSNGNTTIVTHTQTLVGQLSRPKPFYNNDVYLIFGSDVAPDLEFSRNPTKIKAGNISERKLNRIVKKTGKKLDKKTRSDMMDNDPNTNYVKMSNNEFETLFNCTNRTNERQFRVLFTPLAQSNFIDLFKKNPYGDDFSFTKDGKINIIRSDHAYGFDFHAAPWIFRGFDYEKVHNFFVEYCCEYFKSIYFDLAPILSIPMYQNIQAETYGYNSKNYYNTTFHEVESLCNYYGEEHFCHPETNSRTILKCSHNKKDGAIDNVTINAYSFKTIPRIDFVPVMAGNGRIYQVPVHWQEYIPVSKSTDIKAYDAEGYANASKDKKADIYKDYKVTSIYGQKGLALSY